MLSLKDCLDFCDLDCSGIEAIAEHEHIPVIVAAELSNELLKPQKALAACMRWRWTTSIRPWRRGIGKNAAFKLAYQHLQATYPLPTQ